MKNKILGFLIVTIFCIVGYSSAGIRVDGVVQGTGGFTNGTDITVGSLVVEGDTSTISMANNISINGTTPELTIYNNATKNLVINTTSGYVGIGASPSYELDINPSGANSRAFFQMAGPNLEVDGYANSSGNYLNIYGMKGRGTKAAPLVVRENDGLFNLIGYGYTGTNMKSAGGIYAEVDGTPGSNDMPGRLLFKTTPDGSSSMSERMRIGNNGYVSIGTTTNNLKTLTLNGNQLIFDTADIDADKITGGAFTGGIAAQWTYSDTEWSYGTNNIIKDADGTGTLVQTSADMATPLVPGEYYILTFTLSSVTDGSTIAITIGGATLRTATASYSQIFQATSTADLVFTPSSTSRFTLDTVVLKKITGGDITVLGNIVAVPQTVQTIAAGNTITANAGGGLKLISSAADVTTNTTNTFTAPSTSLAGMLMDVVNTGAYNITLDYNSLFASKGASNVILGPSDTVRVGCSGSAWYQIGDTGDN